MKSCCFAGASITMMVECPNSVFAITPKTVGNP